MTADPIFIAAILAIISAACTGLSILTGGKEVDVSDAFGETIGKMLSSEKNVFSAIMIHLAWVAALAAGIIALADWAY